MNVPATPAYDIDGDPTTFNTTELANIQQTWARVAEKFSPFNIDVTTADPGSYPTGVALRVVVGGTSAWTGLLISGSASYNAFFDSTQPSVAYEFASGGAPFAMSEGIANEVGTAFGLYGQSVYNNGTAPNPGNVTLAPIMGNSQVSRRGLWWNGNVLFFFNPTTGVVTGQSQDDMSLLASKFGYRADGIGNALSTASPLAVSGSTLTGSGIIAQTTESDYFSFTTTGGQVTLNGNAAQYGAMLTPKLTLFNSAGQQIGLADAGTAGESLTMTLASGTYYVSVSGHGMIPCYNSAGTFVGSGADVGQYTLSVTAPTGTTAQPPAAPVNLNATGGTAQDFLSWSAVSGATSYNIYRSSFSGGETLVQSGVTSTGYTDSGLSAGTYYYEVAAVNSAGVSPLSSEASATATAPITIPAAPTGINAVGGVGQISVAWSAVSGATTYSLYRGTSSGAETLYASGLTSTGYTDLGLSAGTYYYRVTAVNSAGVSPLSSEASATATAQVTIPVAPTGVNAVGGVGLISVAWSAVSGATTYSLYRGTASGAETLYASGLTATSYNNSGLQNGARYYYKVVAVNSAGSSALSAEVLAFTASAPGQVTGLVATGGAGQVGLSWTPTPGATSYNIYRATTSGAERLLMSGVTSTIITDGNLPAGTYYYDVTATNALGMGSTSAEVAATVTPTGAVPSQVTGLSATGGSAPGQPELGRRFWRDFL